MRTEQWRYFVEVAKCHSIGIVAEKLFVTQPAISIAIKNIEKELGCILFERSKNGVFLTEVGLKVLEKAEKILREEEEIYLLAEQNNQLAKDKLNGTLNIGTIPILINSFLQNAILDFLNDNPDVSINLKEEKAWDVPTRILNHECDFGIIMVPNNEMENLISDERFCCCKLFEEKVYVVADKSYNLSSKKSINYKDICKLPLACIGSEMLNTYFGIDDRESKVVLTTHSLELIKCAVHRGNAVALLTSAVIDKLQDEKLDILPISHLNNGNICYLYLKNNKKLQIISAFERMILQSY